MAKELSGVVWVQRFPTDRLTSTLVDGFRQNCEAFIDALETAGSTVTISATRRPLERAYLMHWSFLITAGQVDPENVPPQAGVDIEWVHRAPNGAPDLMASRTAAAAMVHGYDIVAEPSLNSLHIFGKAIDMSVAWENTLAIARKNGVTTMIASEPRSGLNPELWAVGATYSVIKLQTDRPHWSINGH